MSGFFDVFDPPVDRPRARVHAPGCPDPDEILGTHAACPCGACLDTGWLGENIEQPDCPCGAADRPIDERLARLAIVTRHR